MKKRAGILLLCLAAAVFSALAAGDEWICPNCGRTENYGRFCGACGSEREAGGTLAEVYAAGELTPGKIVRFGRYEQDNQSENGPEPIRWIVLDTGLKRCALLLSQYGLEVRPYHTGWTHVFPPESDCSKWLEEEFAPRAFSEEESRLIREVGFDNNGLTRNFVERKTDSGRKLFLLSEMDVREYFEKTASNPGREKCAPTAYAAARGAYTEGGETGQYGWWWLRTWDQNAAGLEGFGPRVMDSGGRMRNYGAKNGRVMIRPACWVDLAKLDGN